MTRPVIPDSFRWTTESWGPALRCRALDEIAPHLFTTRQLQFTSPEDVRRMAESVGATGVAQVTQVHGNRVRVVRDATAVQERPDADALVSTSPEIAVAVRAADCVPILIADRRTGAVGAVHAGWRGTAARIAPAAVDALARAFGSRPGDLVAAIGPSIGACCYEVGPELVDAFAAAGHERYLIDRWFLAPAPSREFGAPPRGRLRLDVAGANRDQLILSGMQEDQIHLAGLCTAMHLDLFTSYRAERERAGRIGAVIRAGEAAR